MVLGVAKRNRAQKMKIDDPEQKEVAAGSKEVKKEKKDDDDQSELSTVAAGDEEIPQGSGRAPPAGNEEASSGSGRLPPTEANEEQVLPKLILPNADGERAKKKRRIDRSASPTPDRGKEEEKAAEDKRQARLEEEGEATARRTKEDADPQGCGEMPTFTNSMYEELIMETQMFNQTYGGEDHPPSSKRQKGIVL